MYIGSWKIDDLLTFYANTSRFDTGAATDADAVPSYHVYEDETATPLLTGTMSLLNGNNTIGFYSEQITLSAANGFEKGKQYSIYKQATVNSVIGASHDTFQIEAEVDANTVSPSVTAGNVTGSVFGNLNGNVGGNVNGNVVGSVGSVVAPVTAGNVTGSVFGNVNGSVNSVVQPVGILTGTFLEAAADKVWDEAIAGHLSAGSTGEKLNAAGSAGDPWSTALPGSYTPGQAGHILASRMPTGTVVVSSNQDKTGYSLSSPQNFDLIGNHSGTLTNVLNVVNPVVAGVVTGSVLGNVNGSVGSVVNPVGISTGTFFDALADKVWDEPLSGHLSAGSAGNALNSAGAAGDPWSTPLPGSYTAGQAGHILASRMPTGTVLVGDKTGFSLSTPQNFDNNGTLTNVLNVINPVVAGVVTGSVLGNVNGSVGSVTNPVGINTGTFLSAVADQVWDEQLSGHQSAGSAGNALSSAGSAGDPWSTVLPGAYTAGQAGGILASRMPTGTVIVSSNQDKTGYSLSSPQNFHLVGNISGTFVGNISGQLSDISSTLGNKIADYILRRSLASAAASSDGDSVIFRSLLGAARKLVNRWKITGTTLTVYREDDSTSAGTQTLTGSTGTNPIVEIDTD